MDQVRIGLHKKKVENNVEYYDRFGNHRPPLDLVKYLSVNRIKYNQNIIRICESLA